MYPVPVTLHTNDEGNLSEFIYYRLTLIDLDILQILSNISALTENLCLHDVDYQAFMESLLIYRKCSTVLADALDTPNHRIECSEIDQALRGISPSNPYLKLRSLGVPKSDLFFNQLSSRIWELSGFYGKIACKPWHGYPIGEAIDDVLYLSQQVAYLLPENPNFKPYAGQSKAGKNRAEKFKMEKQQILHLWHDELFPNDYYSLNDAKKDLACATAMNTICQKIKDLTGRDTLHKSSRIQEMLRENPKPQS